MPSLTLAEYLDELDGALDAENLVWVDLESDPEECWRQNVPIERVVAEARTNAQRHPEDRERSALKEVGRA